MFLAFAVVPGIAALALAFVLSPFEGIDSVWRMAVIFALFGAYPSAVVVGLPVYGFLSQRVSPTWLNCTLAGAFVAAIPLLLLFVLAPSADQASVGGKATIVDGTTTLYGWLLNFQFVGEIALLGAGAGWLFWQIISAGRRASCSD